LVRLTQRYVNAPNRSQWPWSVRRWGRTINNDHDHGHAAGDELLRTVGNQIRHALRSYDLLVRYGGDEFLCVPSDTNAADAAQRFDSVNAALAVGPIQVPGQSVSPNGS
jgi:diguanylate cyclase (GGDEF)-like protein